MAGLGRRSHYRKHLTDSVLNDLPEPTNSNQRIAKVVGTRGSNQFELVVAPPTAAHDGNGNGNGNGNEVESEMDIHIDMTPQLSILPTKYRKLIWLKRNDYVICECAEDDDKVQVNNNNNENTTINTNTNTIDGGIRYMITHILYKDQIKHLKEKKMWPQHSFFASHGGKKNQIRGGGSDDQIREENEILMERAKALIKEEVKSNRLKQVGEEEEEEMDGSNHDNNDDGLQYDDDDENHDYNDNDDGIIFSNNNEDYFVNMNRIAKLKIDDSSSDEDSD